MKLFELRYAGVLLLSLSAMTGCGSEDGPQRVPVSGAVFVGGRPLEAGTVRLVPIDGTKGPMASGAIVDGYYSLTQENGPVVGKHRVEIEAANFLGFDPGDEAAFRAALVKNRGKLPRSPVAVSYGRRSKLTADIPPEGATELNFMLDPVSSKLASK